MSSHSYSASCPNCENEMDMCMDTRPYELISGWCLYCGFQVEPHESYMTLDEVNAIRGDQELPPLDKLPDRTYEVMPEKETIHCGCGQPIALHDGEWLHVYNPELTGADDHEARPEGKVEAAS